MVSKITLDLMLEMLDKEITFLKRIDHRCTLEDKYKFSYKEILEELKQFY